MADKDSDMCQICKSSRYLNPDMKFLVNPECYHKMCESCVDRIFSLGPAPCPYVGCGKILRKNKFKTQLFEDTGVEREVDVRQRVKKTFNKTQQNFDSLMDYNNYLEEVETIIFNVVNGVDVEETERKLAAYELANRNLIKANMLRQKQEEDMQEELRVLEKERRRKVNQLTRELDDEERRIKQQAEQELVRQLATSHGDAASIVQKMTKIALKKTSSKRKELEALMAMPPPQSHFVVDSGHKNKVSTPFTPFNGDRQKEYLFTVDDSYFDPMMDDVKDDLKYKAGGFLIKDAYKQALVQAFFGLNCDIKSERAAQQVV
jgi:CDK-activating kinase assembly factor MAT1